ncbi:MAG TPA: hypothetical protein VIL07_07620 [Symbiobacteriaceae bacterium]
MSLAHDPFRFGRASKGSAAYAVPKAEPGRRPEPRKAAQPKRRFRGPVLLAVASWACVMGFAMLVVQRNSLVMAESAAVTKLRAQLAQVQKENKELEDKITEQTSVEAIIRWAEAHNMQRVAEVRTLEGAPTATAAVPEPPAAPEAAPARDPVPMGFWQSLKARLAGLTQWGQSARAVNP